jgi:hypothetical protein
MSTISERQKRLRRYMETSFSKYFHKLFIGTYWAGNEPYSDDIEKIICKNRDTIAERYSFQKRLNFSSIPKKYLNKIIIYNTKSINKKKEELNKPFYSHYSERDKEKEFKRWMNKCLEDWDTFTWMRDHIEYYKTRDGKIASIFSINYLYAEANKEYLEDSGYVLIEPIYDINQNTYIKLIDKE